MKNLINAIQFITPQTIEEVESEINGKIKIVKIFGKPRMHVHGFLYSGGIVNQIWKKAIERVKIYDLRFKNVLILGLGGGTAARIISENFPEAKIVGVEIDKEIIRLGKRYFKVGKIPSLKIVCTNAIEYVEKVKSTIKNSKLEENQHGFDLIVVDIYLGEKVPEKAKSKEFLERLKKILAKNGVIIFNRLFYKKHKKKAEKFVKKLEKIFSNIKLVRTPSNLLVFAWD